MTAPARPPLTSSRLTLVLLVLTAAALLLSLPGALRDARERGRIYLFTWEFLADIPARLGGPGKMRFVLQPAMAIFLGLRDGRADARAGRSGRLRDVMATASGMVNLILMAVLLDAIFQWVILGVAHPVAALLVGPVLITLPYVIARFLGSRAAR